MRRKLASPTPLLSIRQNLKGESLDTVRQICTTLTATCPTLTPHLLGELLLGLTGLFAVRGL